MDQIKSLSRNTIWKIHNVTKERLSERKILISSDFEIIIDNKVTKWCYSAKIEGPKFYVYLNMRKPYADLEFRVKYDFYVRTLNYECTNYYSFEVDCNDFKNSGRGCNAFRSVSDLFENSDKYLHNGILTLGGKVELIKTANEDPSTAYPQHSFVDVYKDYFNNPSYSDLKFVLSDGTEIAAHRLILDIASPVFQFMINLGSNKIIKVNDIDSGTMTELMRFIYTGKVNNINEYAPKLFYGAVKYELEELKEFCEATMMKNLSVVNAVDYLLIADEYDAEDLMDSCIQFIKENHQTVLKNDESLNKLDKRHLKLILENYQQYPECVVILESSIQK